uniref:Reverse transcriptase zinc-binding domain-containing protein n=1 Tax=Aegilops tauschii subsp. strangulata TaxID=200361 RepID=A0A453EL46_AEGTS
VILTKDNLLRRRWVGSSRCCYCDQDETIQHLFLDCPLAKLFWRSVHVAFNISPPNSIEMLFGTWLDGVNVHLARNIRIGICALIWAI